MEKLKAPSLARSIKSWHKIRRKGIDKMIVNETVRSYYCDDCGDQIIAKHEPMMYMFDEIKLNVMLCGECKEKLREWLKGDD